MIAIDRYLLPEGDHRILAWFREHLHVPHGWRERMARPGPLRSASPTPSESAMIDAAREAYGRMRFIAQKDYPHGERERLVLFFFEEDGDRPVTVVKLRREGSGGRSLEQEWQACFRMWR